MLDDVTDQFVFQLAQISALVLDFVSLQLAGLLVVKVVVDKIGAKLEEIADDGVASTAFKGLKDLLGENRLVGLQLKGNELDGLAAKQRTN